jgi:poly(A) polymerase
MWNWQPQSTHTWRSIVDPIEVVQLCVRGAFKGAPGDLVVPRIFSPVDYEMAWRRDPVKVRKLFNELLCAQYADVGLELMMRAGVFDAFLPELTAIRNLGDDPAASFKDVWEHTKQVVMSVPPQEDLRWGSLFHDIGKAKTRRVVNGRVTFHNHDRVGARMVDALHDRTRLFMNDVALLRTVRYLVMEHLRPAGYNPEWTDSAVRRLVTECGDVRFFEKLMLLSRADLTTKNPKKRERCLARAAELEKRVAHIVDIDNAPRLPKGTMGIIMEKVAARPGPWLQAVREQLEAMMKAGVLLANQPTDYYVKAGLDIVEQAADAPDAG